MTERVYGLPGKAVEVATLGDVEGKINDIPIATADVAGIIRAAVPVEDLKIIEITDLETGREQVINLNTAVSELMTAMRKAGMLGE